MGLLHMEGFLVKVWLRRNAGKQVVELRCSGHAGFDDGRGNDLVCAAVSALTGALGLGLSEVAGWPQVVEASAGEFRLHLSDAQAGEARLLTETVVRALEQMEHHYTGSLQVEHLEERNSGLD